MDDCHEARAVYAAAGVHAPTAFIGYGVMGADMSVQRLTARIQEVVDAGIASCEVRVVVCPRPCSQPDVAWCQFMVHPGLVSPPSGAGCGGGVDEFAQSTDREHELAVLAGVCSIACGAGVADYQTQRLPTHACPGRELKAFIEALVTKGSLKVVSYGEWAASVAARKASANK